MFDVVLLFSCTSISMYLFKPPPTTTWLWLAQTFGASSLENISSTCQSESVVVAVASRSGAQRGEGERRTLGRTVRSIYMCSSTFLFFFLKLLFTVNTVHPQNLHDTVASSATDWKRVCRWAGRQRERERWRRRTASVSFKEEATDRHLLPS